ncbi:hypothetical protein J437_LFUL011526 [Ladona fulva]|uniref:Uncharacterized protein n=1 Tax=Ladona fulva TaxID=123851 RepID=A0A8K0P4D9_LADFU|nr:hypothetical protein J437_LFUL011526 [Ladona fulva]
METSSQSRDSVFMEESVRAIPGSSNITYRRGSSAGHSYGDSFDRQFCYSWYSPPHGNEERYSSDFEVIAKRRRLEMEDESDEITECRKSLQEAILRLHGNEIDLQPYSLLELINELTNLAEEKKPVVIAQEQSLADQIKISSLEGQLEKAKSEFEALMTQKNELESLLNLEKDKFVNVENQLEEALKKVELLSKQTEGQIYSDGEKSFLSLETENLVKKSLPLEEDELLKLGDMQDCKFEELKREIEGKNLLVAKLEAREKELTSLLGEERIKRIEVEADLQRKISDARNFLVEEGNLNISNTVNEELESNTKPKEIPLANSPNADLCVNCAADVGDTSSKYLEKIAEYERKLVELQNSLTENLEENSRLAKEKEILQLLSTSGQGNCETCLKLDEKLTKIPDHSNKEESTSQENISLQIQMNEKNQEIEKLGCQLKEKEVEIETLRCRVEELKAEFIEEKKRSDEMEMEKVHAPTSLSSEEYGYFSDLLDEYEKKIEQLEVNLAQNCYETNKIILEKKECESLFASSKEKYRILHVKLGEALNNLGSASEKITIYEQRMAELEEKFAKHILETSNLASEKEEFKSLFTSGKDKYKALERKLEETLASNDLDSSQKKLDQAEVLNELILKLKNELISKESELGMMYEKLVALHAELNEERAIKAAMEQKLVAEQNSDLGNQHKEIEELLATVAAQENKIIELQVRVSEKEELQSNMLTLDKLAKESELLLEEERKKSKSLKEDVNQLLHELNNLKVERDMLLSYQQDDDTLSKETESLRSLFEKCKKELLSVELERDDLMSELASKEQQNEYLQNQLSDAVSNVETLSNQLAELMVKCENFKDKEAELLSLRAELEQAKFSLEFCAQSEEELDNLLSVEKKKVRDLQNELNELKEENEKLTYSREGEMANLEGTKFLQISLDECKSELSNVMLENNDLISSLDSMKCHNATLQNQLINAQLDIDSLSKKLAEAESQYESIKDKDSELESLKAELENAKLSVHTKSKEDLDNLLSIEKLKVSNLQKELSKASAEKNDLLNEKIKLAESLEKIELELASLVDEHIKCTENEIKMIGLEEALQEANENVANLRKEKELELENERKRSEKIISEKEEFINELLEENKTISGVSEEKLSSLEKMLEMEVAKCEEKTEEIHSLKADKNRMEEMLKAEKDKVADLERQIITEEEKIQNLKVALEEQVQEKEKLRVLEFDLQRRICHESLNEKELKNKNLELICSMEKMEHQLKLLNQDHSTILANNIKLSATNDELSAEVDVLQMKLSSSKLEVERLEASLNGKEDLLSKMEKRSEEMSSLLVMSSRKVSELEKDVEEIKDELHLKINEVSDGAKKISELQSSLAEAHRQIGDMAKEVSHLEEALQNSKETLKSLDSDGNEIERNQTVINDMEEQMAALKEERKAEIESYEEKIATLERLVTVESEKCAMKTSEVHMLKMNKGRLEEMLQAEKDRVSDLEKQILIDEEKLVSVKEEIEEQRQENDRMKAVEIDLTSKFELERQKNVITENELDKLKAALSSSEINLNQLKCEVASLKKRLMEETSMVAQLKVQLETEKKAYLAAKEAEGRVLSVLSAQEKAKSVLSFTEGSSMESKTESSTDEERKQIKELMEKLEDQEKYIQQFDKTIEKMELRYNRTLDHRLEIQKKAKERETELLSEISELQKKIGQVPITEEAKSNVSELEKEVQHARLKIEETEKKLQAAMLEAKTYHSQANDFKREILRCKQLLQAGVTRTEAKVECGVQTVPIAAPVVEDVRPGGSGIVQYYKIDCLEKKVKELEKEKEFLKKLCRRRHDQREELKLKLEALTGKRDVYASNNKENDSMNV